MASSASMQFVVLKSEIDAHRVKYVQGMNEMLSRVRCVDRDVYADCSAFLVMDSLNIGEQHKMISERKNKLVPNEGNLLQDCMLFKWKCDRDYLFMRFAVAYVYRQLGPELTDMIRKYGRLDE